MLEVFIKFSLPCNTPYMHCQHLWCSSYVICALPHSLGQLLCTQRQTTPSSEFIGLIRVPTCSRSSSTDDYVCTFHRAGHAQHTSWWIFAYTTYRSYWQSTLLNEEVIKSFSQSKVHPIKTVNTYLSFNLSSIVIRVNVFLEDSTRNQSNSSSSQRRKKW